MNERIRELARQSGFYITIDGSGIFIPDPHSHRKHDVFGFCTSGTISS
jgi:hypothetical protein